MLRGVRKCKAALAFLLTLALAVTAGSPVAAAGKPVTVPAGGSDVRPLGTQFDPGSGKFVQGYAIVHYGNGAGNARGTEDARGGYDRGGNKPPGKGGGKNATQCYGFLAKDAKWKSVEPWVVNPSNTSGLDGAFIASNLAADIAKWEDAADGAVGSGPGADILGDGSTTAAALEADTASPDDVNEVYFADIAEPGAIGVTIVWGFFGGPPFQRELVEWDQVYDDVDYAWSATGAAGAMDFENIATHELGHSVGLGDLYDSACAAETMYGYADLGETNKRDLNAGDITGVDKLY